MYGNGASEMPLKTETKHLNYLVHFNTLLNTGNINTKDLQFIIRMTEIRCHANRILYRNFCFCFETNSLCVYRN